MLEYERHKRETPSKVLCSSTTATFPGTQDTLPYHRLSDNTTKAQAQQLTLIRRFQVFNLAYISSHLNVKIAAFLTDENSQNFLSLFVLSILAPIGR